MRIFGDRIITEKKRSGFEVLYGKRSFVVYNKNKSSSKQPYNH